MSDKMGFLFICFRKKKGISNQRVPSYSNNPTQMISIILLLWNIMPYDETIIYQTSHCILRFSNITCHTKKNELDPGTVKEKFIETIFQKV